MKQNIVLFKKLQTVIETLNVNSISNDRKETLQPLVNYIKHKTTNNHIINLNFICTHNSRRSHLSQVWAQTLAAYFNIRNVNCYSGGTEATALFPKVAETLKNNGFEIETLSEGLNPVYSIKYSENQLPIICFSKTFDANFNPKTNFAAILTCDHANENCPIIHGAEERFPIMYLDPKVSDNTPNQNKVYNERSLQIATEMKYIFSQINQ